MSKNRVLYQKTLTYRMGHAEKSNACVCVCRMENRNRANQEERMNEAPSASAGNGLIQFYYSLINIDERE